VDLFLIAIVVHEYITTDIIFGIMEPKDGEVCECDLGERADSGRLSYFDGSTG